MIQCLQKCQAIEEHIKLIVRNSKLCACNTCDGFIDYIKLHAVGCRRRVLYRRSIFNHTHRTRKLGELACAAYLCIYYQYHARTNSSAQQITCSSVPVCAPAPLAPWAANRPLSVNVMNGPSCGRPGSVLGYAICVLARGFTYALFRSGRHWRVERQWR